MFAQAAQPFRRQQRTRLRRTGMTTLSGCLVFDEIWTPYSWGVEGFSMPMAHTPNTPETRSKLVRKLEALIRNCGAFTAAEEVLLGAIFGLFGQSSLPSKQIVERTGNFSRVRLQRIEDKISMLLNRLKTEASWALQHVPTNWRSSESLPPQNSTASELATVLRLFG